MKEREPGYYWVQKTYDSEWQIARWNNVFFCCWLLFGVERDYVDSDFYKIDERQIKREEQIKP